MIFTAAFIVLTPLLILSLPGLAFLNDRQPPLQALARLILWSLSLLICGLWLAAYFGMPSTLVVLGLVIASPLTLIWQLRKGVSLPWVWLMGGLTIICVSLYAAFSIPYLIYHDGLPTGDSQKAIIWGLDIARTHQLPDYHLSLEKYNRDAADFLTPGLHALTALLIQWNNDYLMTVGLLSIALAVATACIAAALLAHLSPASSFLWPGLAAFFVLTNIRFLRYVREPGYHLQNVLGEVLLFGLLLIIVTLLKRWRLSDSLLAIFLIIALAVSHQFSLFIALSLVPAILMVTVIANRSHFKMQWQIVRLRLIAIGIILVVTSFIASPIFNLPQKMADIFNRTPHLSNYLPVWSEYPEHLGIVLLISGLTGWIGLLWSKTPSLATYLERLAFVLSAGTILILSQGPRFGLDIPPARALFYSVVPVSIGAAFFWQQLTHVVQQRRPKYQRLVAFSFINCLILLPAGNAVVTAYSGLSHTIAPNATLTPEIQILIQYLKQHPSGGILTDDFNRRASSWLILSQQPTLTRIAGLDRQMAEAEQSPQRATLYHNQLDYEKIFDLGSLPFIQDLTDKHNVTWLTGIDGSSQSSLGLNPLLKEAATADSIRLYKIQPPAAGALPPIFDQPTINWLLASTTLANDIGDLEDTFEHLPASLAATRLSEPQQTSEPSYSITYRSTSAPLIPLRFNVNDYVASVWQQANPAAYRLFVAATPVDALQLDGFLSPPSTSSSAQPWSVIIPATDLPIDDRGFITVMLHNPHQQAIRFDLIALGLVPTISH